MISKEQNKDYKTNNGPLVSQDIPTGFEYSTKLIKPIRSTKKKPGIILDDNYAKLIRARKKKEIISTENFYKYIGKELYLCGKYVYGSIILNDPMRVDKELLENHKKRHLMNLYDINRLWPDGKNFYVYSFRITEMLKKPARYINSDINIGVIDDIEFKSKKVKEKMRDIPNTNREYDEELMTKREHENKVEPRKEEKEILKSNSRLDKYDKILNSLMKNFVFTEKYEDIANLFIILYEFYLEKAKGKIYDKDGIVLKPAPDITENYIRVRIRDPKTIVEGSFRTIIISESQGIKAVIGRLKKDPNGSTKIQSVLFDKEKWTVDRALAWVDKHKEDLKNLLAEDFKEKRLDSYINSDYISPDKDTGKQKEKWVWCKNCEKYFDYYKQLLDDKSTLLCPHCGALVIFEEK